jgi:hypothetical protein
MAQYTRFEIYIPVAYTTTELDPQTGKTRKVVHSLDDELVRGFIEATIKKFDGITQANPLAPAAFKGWWQGKSEGTITVDYLTYLFGLIKVDDSDEARQFFREWQLKFKSATYQLEILLIYYPVQTIVDFF